MSAANRYHLLPGGDFCTLANARSITLAKAIDERFDNIDFLHDIGDVDLNISGCVNACGHTTSVNRILVWISKDEWYQVSIGGSKGSPANIGKIIGRSFSFAQIPTVIERLLQVYVRERHEGERFVDTVRRVGNDLSSSTYMRHR